MRRKPTKDPPPGQTLQGWKEVSAYLGIPVSTAHRWARSGMPIEREGRKISANVAELTNWLGRESHMPAAAHVATDNADLASALQESIAEVRPTRKRRAA